MMRIVWILFVCLTGLAARAAELPDARAELLKARTALEGGRFSEALQHTARVQTFYYRDEEAVASALYYEALIDHKKGGSTATVSALTELETLCPNSEWCRKALKELKDADRAE